MSASGEWREAGGDWPKVIYVCPECGEVYVEETPDGFCESDLHVVSLERVEVVPVSGPPLTAEEAEALQNAMRAIDYDYEAFVRAEAKLRAIASGRAATEEGDK